MKLFYAPKLSLITTLVVLVLITAELFYGKSQGLAISELPIWLVALFYCTCAWNIWDDVRHIRKEGK